MRYDLAIVGCGISGAATAYFAAQQQLSVLILEAAHDVACGATKANSAILHAGYDPEPGSIMARTNVRGVALARELCAALDVPLRENGALVLAFDEADRAHVERLYARGIENGVVGLAIVEQEELRRLEPGVAAEAICALHAPSSAIVDPWEFCIALTEVAVRNGARLELGAQVSAIVADEEGFDIATAQGERYRARYIVNAAGIGAGDVHRMIGGRDFGCHPTRGEYYLLDKSAGASVRHTLFQCPTVLGKGVLVSPTVHGNVIVGPNAEAIEDPRGVMTTQAGLAEVARAARRSLPALPLYENIRNFAGLRAVIDEADFVVAPSERDGRFINLAGIKSPGLSSAPALAEMALELLAAAGLEQRPRADAVRSRRRIRFRELEVAERRELIAQDPAWGRVICRCETVTEAEIVAAIHGPVPARSIDAVKRHANPGMGRCQGGFCGPRVQAILARELGIGYDEVCQHEPGSELVIGRTGEVPAAVEAAAFAPAVSEEVQR